MIWNFVAYYLLSKCKVSYEVKSNNIGNLSEKFEYYKANKDSFNLVFVGDSRTYTNIHNFMLDSLLNSKSFNHAVWANWFPTQYAFLVDFLPQIPDSTTLVFSFGHQNFIGGEIQETYPINRSIISQYYSWGFSFTELLKPISISDNEIHKIVFLEKNRHRRAIKVGLSKLIAVIFSKNKGSNRDKKSFTENRNDSNKEASRANSLNAYYRSIPEVSFSSIKFQDETPTSLEVYWKKGNYWRVEIVPQYFREKQNENYLELKKVYKAQSKFEPEQKYWNNFLAIAKLLGKHSKRLKIIVNEMEEAPYTYKLSGRSIYNNFIKNDVLPILSENNLTSIKVGVNDFSDNYYFDYNHLNNIGSVAYTKKLALVLSPHFKK